ncbi:GrpB family protein [Bacillus sp. T33-2]|uniref:GrpB family protein n=1 Tax=Bacillus sp. T33-2 TaxID=2054168 RepID=UPI000C7622EB|nr:GrpB family protein [Bacillus sp. T33-2]PLR99824.1 hypothetical protein CVD19_01840 [Bacillus sp. T33-2]
MTRRKVEVVPYSHEWVRLFEHESELLHHVFYPHNVDIHHIGSTSVPGLSAKPIIDLLLEADEISMVDFATPALEKTGFVGKGENGLPGRRYFYKLDEAGNRLFHLHAYANGNPEIVRHLAFRDYLRAHPDEALRYQEVKERAASAYTYDIEAYIAEKAPIVEQLERRALDRNSSWKKIIK